MSTRSCVAIENKDGSIESNYVHFDGYLGGVGLTLYLHYEEQKLREFLKQGSCSVLGETLELPHSKFYMRDNGEQNQYAQKYSSRADWKENGAYGEYNYLYSVRRKSWYVMLPRNMSVGNNLHSLRSVLLKNIKNLQPNRAQEFLARLEKEKLFTKLKDLYPEQVGLEEKPSSAKRKKI